MKTLGRPLALAVAATVLLSPAAVDALSTGPAPARQNQRAAASSLTAPPAWRLSAAAVDDVSIATENTTPGDSRRGDGRPDPPPLSSLPLPPRKGGPLRRFRDTISYLKDPEGFIERRSEELGPVFSMYQFFKPVVVVGGRDAVREFIQEREEAARVIHPDLPPAFVDLHTRWSTLNMDSTQEEFRQARGLFRGLLQAPEARNMYVQTILPEIERYADGLLERVRADPGEQQYLVPEMKELCLQIFARIFSGEGLSKEQVQMFYDYNSALLSLSKSSDQYKRGMAALDGLSAEMLRRFRIMERNAADGDAKDFPAKYVFGVFQTQEGYVDVGNYERIPVAMLLMIWGAYVESAALMVDTAVSILDRGIDPAATVSRELRDQEAKGLRNTELAYWDGMKYTIGIVRETMRLVPPGAGVPRYGEADFSLGGYRIPAGLSVIMDPRIGNKDPGLFEQASEFEPLRWVPEGTAIAAVSPSSSSCPFKGTALKLGAGSWFPGGNGAHRCPGVPLAELVSTMFVATLSERFVSWEFGGSGLTKDGKVKYVEIPIKICPDDLGLKFTVRES